MGNPEAGGPEKGRFSQRLGKAQSQLRMLLSQVRAGRDPPPGPFPLCERGRLSREALQISRSSAVQRAWGCRRKVPTALLFLRSGDRDVPEGETRQAGK